MKVSVDGIRRNATRSMNMLGNKIKQIITEEESLCIQKPSLILDLINLFDSAAQDVDMFNCCFSENKEDMFNDLSNELHIMRLGDDEDGDS